MSLHSVLSIKGSRDYMEDRYNFVTRDGITIALVCDGHGGSRAATATAKHFPTHIFDSLRNFSKTASPTAIAQKLQSSIVRWGQMRSRMQSGSTLACVILIGKTMFVVNIGDSRVVANLRRNTRMQFMRPHFRGEELLYSQVETQNGNFFQTIDHTPLSERHRIEDAGGRVMYNRLNGILAMARSIGDRDVGLGLSFVPDIFWMPRYNIRGPVLLISDGVYDGNPYVANETLLGIGQQQGASKVVEYAVGAGSGDNITAMLINV